MANSIQKQVINVASRVILGNHLWTVVLDLVSQVNGQSTLTGPEKRTQVQNDLIHLFKDVGLSLLNLGIELAVTYLTLSQPVVAAVVAAPAAAASQKIEKEISR
jgi:hypothetical protein